MRNGQQITRRWSCASPRICSDGFPSTAWSAKKLASGSFQKTTLLCVHGPWWRYQSLNPGVGQLIASYAYLCLLTQRLKKEQAIRPSPNWVIYARTPHRVAHSLPLARQNGRKQAISYASPSSYFDRRSHWGNHILCSCKTKYNQTKREPLHKVQHSTIMKLQVSRGAKVKKASIGTTAGWRILTTS